MTKKNERQQHLAAANRQAEQLADGVWALTAEWGEFAKSSIGLALTQTVDAVGLNLLMSLGPKSVKDHMQAILRARNSLTPASYWLQRAIKRGLIAPLEGQKLNAQMTELAECLDQHTQSVLKINQQLAAQQYQTMAQDGRPEDKNQEADEIAEEPAMAH